MSFKKILVAIDRSPQAAFVFQQALEQAQNGGRLLLAHIIPDADLQTVSLGIATLADVDTYGTLKHLHQERLSKQTQSAQQYIHAYQQQAIAAGIDTEIDCQVGEPSVTLCNLAQSWGADLIMLGRRGHQGMREVVLGSVSNYVVHHAGCSVLVVQGEMAAKEE